MTDLASRRSARFSVRSKQLGRILMENNAVQVEQIAKALKIQEQRGGLLGFILREMGACDDAAIAAALLKQVQVSDICCADVTVPAEYTALVPKELCLSEKLSPFERLGGLLCVVMGNPLNRRAIDNIEQTTGLKVKPFKAPWAHIKELIERTYTPENIAAAQTGNATASAVPTISLSEEPAEAVPEEISLDLEPEPAVPAPAPTPAPPSPLPDTQAPKTSKTTPRKKDAEQEVAIEGLDSLGDTDAAEIVEADERGLRKRLRPGKKTKKYKRERPRQGPVQINVDLDSLDLQKADKIVDTSGTDDEPMEEIVAEASDKSAGEGAAALFSDVPDTGTPVPDAALEKVAPAEVKKDNAQESVPLALGLVEDADFYAADALPPAATERSEELAKLLDELPVAEVVAECVADWRRQRARTSATARLMPREPATVEAPAPAKQKKVLPVWAEPAPNEVLKATPLEEDAFQEILAEGVEVDPVGEWDGCFAGCGPVIAGPFLEK